MTSEHVRTVRTCRPYITALNIRGFHKFFQEKYIQII